MKATKIADIIRQCRKGVLVGASVACCLGAQVAEACHPCECCCGKGSKKAKMVRVTEYRQGDRVTTVAVYAEPTGRRGDLRLVRQFTPRGTVRYYYVEDR